MILLLLLVAWESGVCTGNFSPNPSDYDAYGLKIAANDIMLVEAENENLSFLVQFAPHNYTDELDCFVTYNDSAHYVYSVGIGSKQNSSQAYFFYAGEIVLNGLSTVDSSNHNGTFIGIVRNNDPQNPQSYIDKNESVTCDLFEYENVEFISSYGHQEFFVFGVDPKGEYAIGLTTDFVFIYRPFSVNTLITIDSHHVWPNNTKFVPLAVETDILYTIVVGFLTNETDYFPNPIPSIYVISNLNFTVLARWSYMAPTNSWQSNVYFAATEWSNDYTMSIKINPDDNTQVLVSMPFLNTIFLFIINSNGTNLTLVSSIDQMEPAGFGKSVTWLSPSKVVILDVSNSPQINMYKLLNNDSLSQSPYFVFPSIVQPLPSAIDSNLIRMISVSDALVILDVNGSPFLLLSAPPGFYASTNSNTSFIDFSPVVISYPSICMPGMYKAGNGIEPCSICPNGSRNPGNSAAIQCINCSSQSFCPFGAIIEIDTALLLPQSQAIAYPRSPEILLFDDILLLNIFSISSQGRCIVISPLFWVLIVIGLILIILIIMNILKWCVKTPKSTRLQSIFKRVFRQVDIVSEGEWWVGGLISLAIIVLLIFTYVFSAAYYQQYPVESVGPSNFACDVTIRNAKFETGLQSLAIPISDKEKPMFDLLNKQKFSLHLELLSTYVTCDDLSVDQILGLLTEGLKPSYCEESNGILSATVDLPFQGVTIQWTINSIQLIGAVRVGLSGPEAESESCTLKELDFSQTFYSEDGGTLAQTVTINMQLTKAINETEPLAEGESEFSGIWYPSFVVDNYQMFVSPKKYALNQTYTTLTIVISEMSYYIQNRQLPIAKQPEIIFHNLLFTIVVLEIFGLVFLIFKLAILPLMTRIVKHCEKKKEHDLSPTTKENVYQENIFTDLDNSGVRF